MSKERQDIHQIIDTLSDDGIRKLAPYAAFLRRQDRTPNAETIAAIEEARAGLDESATLEGIVAECHALAKDNPLV
ncbi:MAG: hypothetical protein LBS45_07000 [Synergistaceae bacterium]|jgi:hypothetical protein|nr:hypothetical protein [Synergistaceae bacterium]